MAESTPERMAREGTIHPMFVKRNPEHQAALDELRREEAAHDRQMELRYKAEHREDEDYEGDWD